MPEIIVPSTHPKFTRCGPMYHAMGRRGVSFDLANILKVLHARLSVLFPTSTITTTRDRAAQLYKMNPHTS